MLFLANWAAHDKKTGRLPYSGLGRGEDNRSVKARRPRRPPEVPCVAFDERRARCDKRRDTCVQCLARFLGSGPITTGVLDCVSAPPNDAETERHE